MGKKIEIKCIGADIVSIQKLKEFQGSLKSLSKENYARLRNQIVELGFSEPLSVWKNKDTIHVLNGHQRLRVVSQMVEKEGFSCAGLPVNWVEADSEKEAKKKVLSLTAQYGEIVEDGLYEFMTEAGLTLEDIKGGMNFPEIDMEHFAANYFEEIPEIASGKELDESLADGLEKKEVECPECGHKFIP